MPDPGRLEDGLVETVLAMGFWFDGTTITARFDPSGPCSHGTAGIFGRRFVDALEKRGQYIMADIAIKVLSRDTHSAVIIGEYRFRLES